MIAPRVVAAIAGRERALPVGVQSVSIMACCGTAKLGRDFAFLDVSPFVAMSWPIRGRAPSPPWPHLWAAIPDDCLRATDGGLPHHPYRPHSQFITIIIVAPVRAGLNFGIDSGLGYSGS